MNDLFERLKITFFEGSLFKEQVIWENSYHERDEMQEVFSTQLSYKKSFL